MEQTRTKWITAYLHAVRNLEPDDLPSLEYILTEFYDEGDSPAAAARFARRWYPSLHD